MNQTRRMARVLAVLPKGEERGHLSVLFALRPPLFLAVEKRAAQAP